MLFPQRFSDCIGKITKVYPNVAFGIACKVFSPNDLTFLRQLRVDAVRVKRGRILPAYLRSIRINSKSGFFADCQPVAQRAISSAWTFGCAANLFFIAAARQVAQGCLLQPISQVHRGWEKESALGSCPIIQATNLGAGVPKLRQMASVEIPTKFPEAAVFVNRLGPLRFSWVRKAQVSVRTRS